MAPMFSKYSMGWLSKLYVHKSHIWFTYAVAFSIQTYAVIFCFEKIIFAYFQESKEVTLNHVMFIAELI